MPIKLPKGFQRRKSSTNALEEVLNPPEPSFRVFERPRAGSKSFDGGHVLRKPGASEERTIASPKHHGESENDELFPVSRLEHGNRSSVWTNNSISTKAPDGSGASSARLSSSSTVPSSTDTHSEIGPTSGNPRPFHDIPVPPTPVSRPPFSLRASARTFSFGSKAAQPSPVAPSRQPGPTFYNQATSTADANRERAFSASTTSTATPPKLLDADMTLGDSDGDGFSNMFDNIGKRSSRHVDKESMPIQAANPGPPDHLRSRKFPLASTDEYQHTGSPRHSYKSQNSQDELMRSPSPDAPQAPLHKALPLPQSMPVPMSIRAADALAAASSPQSQRQQDFQQKRGHYEDNILQAKNTNTSDRTLSFTKSINDTERALSGISPDLASGAFLAAEWEQREQMEPPVSKPASKNKVMTPAQFERYRQQQEMDRRRIEERKGKESDDGSDDYEEDHDEVERDRQAATQRRKQEAHLAVYRQTMMKVTGEQRAKSRHASAEGLGVGMRIPSSGSMDLTKSTSNLTLDPRHSLVNGKSSGEEDEDDDVPLGILAAHGFPNKNRPPTRLSKQPSNPNLRTGPGAVPGPASVTGESRQDPRGSMPPFARHLPQDPYYGAGLVNSTNRESFAMGGGASVSGVPLAGVPPNAHPGGLVGVIAGEERARAMRRGSPNPNASFDLPPNMLASHPGMVRSPSAGFPAPGMIPGMALPLTPGDQAQIQMSQQMNQMMQMQMQWMQQVNQVLQQGQSPGGAPQLPQMLGMPSMPTGMLAPPGQIQRPTSMPMPEAESPRMGQRTMSTLTPGMAPWNRPEVHVSSPGYGYTPSIAPSERSNVGLAPRYRPVTTATGDVFQPMANRSSTFTSSTVPWGSGEAGRRSPGAAGALRPVGGMDRKAAVPDDDDDDQGWREMKQKRDRKKSTWKMKRAQTQGEGLADLYHG